MSKKTGLIVDKSKATKRATDTFLPRGDMTAKRIDTYKQKLISLLKSLEVNEIEELIEKPIIHLVMVGAIIGKAAKGYDLSKQRIKALEAERESHMQFRSCACGLYLKKIEELEEENAGWRQQVEQDEDTKRVLRIELAGLRGVITDVMLEMVTQKENEPLNVEECYEHLKQALHPSPPSERDDDGC